MYTNYKNRKSQSNQLLFESIHPVGSILYYLQGFVLKHKSQRHKPLSIDQYRRHVEKFVWFLEKYDYPTMLEEVEGDCIREFFIYLEEQTSGRWDSQKAAANHPLSPVTIRGFANSLRAFFRWVTKEAPLTANPMANVEMPKTPSQWKVEYYTDEEIVLMFDTCAKAATPFHVQRNRAILAVLLDCGVRASELLGLELGDIDANNSLFKVHGKGDKDRHVAIGGFARKELWTYLNRFRMRMTAFDNALFVTEHGYALTYRGLRQMMRQISVRSGIERIQVRAHTCRHTFATKAHRNGMRGSVLQEALGHTMFDTTRRYYLDIDKEDLAKEHEQYGPLDNMHRKLGVTSSRGRKSVFAQPKDKHNHFGSMLPEAHLLVKEVLNSNYVAVARKYGVSDTAVRKRLKKAGLEIRSGAIKRNIEE